MPFGIPSPPEDSYAALIDGLERNIDDLGKFQASLDGTLQAGRDANKKDLRSAFAKLERRTRDGIAANGDDLAIPAQSVALQLVAGAQANQADLSSAGALNICRDPNDPLCNPNGNGHGPCCHVDDLGHIICDPECSSRPCPPGYHRDPNGMCVPDSIDGCQQCFVYEVIRKGIPWSPNDCGIGIGDGSTGVPPNGRIIWGPSTDIAACQSALGACKRHETPPPPPPASLHPCIQPECPPGQVWSEVCHQCVVPCQPGYHWEPGIGGAACQCVADHICPPGQHWDGTGCVPDHEICPPCDPCPPPPPADGCCPPPEIIVNVPPCPGDEEPPPNGGNGELPHPPELPPGRDDFVEPPLPPVDCLTTGLGFPGTVEFCSCLETVRRDLIAIGQILTEWAQDIINTENILEYLEEVYASIVGGQPIGWALQAIVWTEIQLVRMGGPFFDALLSLIRSALNATARLQTAGEPAVAVALIGLRWTLECVKEFDVGVNFGVEGIDRIRLNYAPLTDLLERLIKYYCPVEPPSPAEATHGWLQGQISPLLRDCVWQLHGLNPQMYLPYAMAEAETLTPEEIIQLGRRRDAQPGQIADALKARGWQREFDLIGKLELYDELPTIGDHLHWLSRNVDDTNYVRRFGLLDGFAPDPVINTFFPGADYVTVTETHGRDFWARYGHDLRARGMKIDYAANHYAAHWIQPSPEQMREFVYRLRPNKEGVDHVFTPEDFDRILAEQDYAPLARQWFGETLPRVPALTYLIGMFRANVISADDLQSYHQDLGYTETDSRRFVGVDQLQKNRIRAGEYRGWTATAIANAYVVGQITDQEVSARMKVLGATDQESENLKRAAQANFDRSIVIRARSRAIFNTFSTVGQSLQVGAISIDDAVQMLVELGSPRDFAYRIANAQIAQGKLRVIKETVAVVRRQFHDGLINWQAAQFMLQTIGIQSDRINQYMTLWTLQNTPRRKRRTASQIVKDLSLGMMDTGEALLRLTNLGYDNADTMLYLADAQRSLIQRQSRAAAAAERDARRAAREQERLARQADAQARRMRSDAMRGAPKSTLVSWLRKGIITPAQFAVRMTRGGFTAADITRYAVGAIHQASETILLRWRKAGIIDDPEFANKLRRIGWADDDIRHFLAEAGAATAKKGASATAGSNGSAGAGGGTAPPGG